MTIPSLTRLAMNRLSLRAKRGNPRSQGPWIATSLALLAMTIPSLARLAMNSPVIAKVAVIANAVKQSMTSDCMDRHGLRPRDDGAGSRLCAVSDRIRGARIDGVWL
jgi:hypothetical protein